MIDEKLMAFLGEETALEDIGNESILHDFPAFGEMVGEAINSGRLLEVTKELSGCLQGMDLYKACMLSNFIGFACEKEQDASAGQGVIELFGRACGKVYELLQDCEEDEFPPDFSGVYAKDRDWVKAYYGFETLCISSMAFLARDPGLRESLWKMELWDQVSYIVEEGPESPYLRSAYYVYRIMDTCGPLSLLVLHPERQKGFFAEANDLNNCFHLLFLLEEQIAAVLGESYGMLGFEADEALVQLAHGAYPEDCDGKSYSTRFMECNYNTAWRDAEAGDLIWGEMPPEGIPAVDGQAVIVLRDTGIPRSFNEGFLVVDHTALSPYVKIERELTDEEYRSWMERLREA